MVWANSSAETASTHTSTPKCTDFIVAWRRHFAHIDPYHCYIVVPFFLSLSLDFSRFDTVCSVFVLVFSLFWISPGSFFSMHLLFYFVLFCLLISQTHNTRTRAELVVQSVCTESHKPILHLYICHRVYSSSQHTIIIISVVVVAVVVGIVFLPLCLVRA